MENNTFLIFEEDKKFHLTRDKIFIYLFLLFFIPLILEQIFSEQANLSQFGKLMFGLLFSTILLSVILKISSVNRYKPLRGRLMNSIEFEIDQILINKKAFHINEMDRIEFYCNDYEGYMTSSGHTLDGFLSNGVNNNVKLYMVGGDYHEVFFLQRREFEIRRVKNQLINYHLNGKIHFLHLIELLGINDYDEIQEFKKQIYGSVKS